MRHLDQNWETKLDAITHDRRVFLALSVTPEAAISYWVEQLDLIDEGAVFERAVEALIAAGYHIFVKDHPSQFGFRKRELVERLARVPGVTFVPYDVPAKTLIDRCKTTMTLTGTVGFEAMMAGRCAVVAASAYYVADPSFVTLKSLAGISDLPGVIERFQMPRDLATARRAVMRRLLRSCVPGQLSWLKWSDLRPGAAEAVETLVTSINNYVPQFISATKPGGSRRAGAAPAPVAAGGHA